jgi:hypothetical protein
MAAYKYAYSVKHAEARYLAEMVALAPAQVSDMFDLIIMNGPDVEFANYASFHLFSEGATTCVVNEAAIFKAKDALADAVAEYAATRTPSRVPKWTFLYNCACKEDCDVVAAIRASPPPVATEFAVSAHLPSGEHCVLFPEGGYGTQARERLLAELKTARDLYFPSRPNVTSRYVLALAARAFKVKEAGTHLLTLGRDIHVKIWAAYTVTTLWFDDKVYYGDGSVLSQLQTIIKSAEFLPTSRPQRPFLYDYNPENDAARYLAEMITLSPPEVLAKFLVRAALASTDINYATFTRDSRTYVNDGALSALKIALMDEVALQPQYAEYTFCYDPASPEDEEAILNLRSFPPNVAMWVAVVKQEDNSSFSSFPADSVCVFRWRDGSPYRGTVARAKMAEVLRAMNVSRFLAHPPWPSPVYKATMVLSCVPSTALADRNPDRASASEKKMYTDIEAALKLLPEHTVYVKYYYVNVVVTSLWTDNGKRVWLGDQSVLAKLHELAKTTKPSAPVLDECIVKESEPVSATAASSPELLKSTKRDLPLKYFLEARKAALVPPAGYDSARGGVRYQMFVRNNERAAFLAQLDTVPADWRRLISVVFVSDETKLTETCVDLWPQVAFFPPKLTCYKDVLEMLSWSAEAPLRL